MVGIEGGALRACGSYSPGVTAPVQTLEDEDPARPGRILLVDDDDGVRSAYRRILAAQGYRIDTAEDGKLALELLASTSYDVVLSDIMMPELGGLEFLRAVRALDLDVPVLLMTGQPRVESAVKAVEFGALQYLVKPIQRAELERAVRRAVQLRRMALAKLQAADLIGSSGLRVTDRVGLHTRLDSALESMWMAFQPILRAADGSIFGHEALLRSSEEALPHPGAVLEAAERLDRLFDVGRSVRAKATDAIEHAPEAGALFVNLHPSDLFDPDLIDEGAKLTHIASRVVLEVTERASLETGEKMKDRIATLRDLGFRIAIDDLGAGYAGLSSFALLEPDIVKLDVSLVRDVHLSRTKQRLIRSMTSLAKDMNILTVAEGIEVREEADKLIELECDLLQGFLFARPERPFPTVKW
jgi:EAL domain-containing protein (putative c-di-GMP-specific phosphodiesterase class I)